jgi:hypothetical protein
MAVLKIELKDKAALLNRMEKVGMPLDTDQIVNNKLEGYFELTVNNPKQLEIVKNVLKQSPKINTIKEMKSRLTRRDLREMVRQELKSVLFENEEKDQMDEAAAPELIAGLATLLGVGGSIAAAMVKDLKGAKTPEEKKKVLQNWSGQIDKRMGGN